MPSNRRIFGNIKKVPMDGTTPNQKYMHYMDAYDTFVFSSGYGSDKLGFSSDGINWTYSSKGTNGEQLHDGKMASIWGAYTFDAISGISSGETVSPTNMFISFEGVETIQQQNTLGVNAIWADVAAYPAASDWDNVEVASFIMVGGRHIMETTDYGGTWTDTEITTSIVPNANSEAVSITSCTNGKFIIIMSEQQNRTDVIPVLYGNSQLGWTYSELVLGEDDMLSTPIAKDNCYIKTNGYLFVQNDGSVYKIAENRLGRLVYMKLNYKVYSEDFVDSYSVAIRAVGDNHIAYGVYKKPVNGIMRQYGCVIDISDFNSSTAIGASTLDMVDGVSIAIGKNIICIGTNNKDYMYYVNYYNPENIKYYGASSFSDIKNSEREDWRNFVETVKEGNFQKATDDVARMEKQRVDANTFNSLLNFIEYAQLMQDEAFKTTDSPKIMTLSDTDPQWDVLENQIYFYLYKEEQ